MNMPLDGSYTKGARAVYVIDRMIDLYDEGRRWCRGWNDGANSHCIVGAMMSIRMTDKIKGDGTSEYIMAAIAEVNPDAHCITLWNDTVADWPKVHALLLRARALAEADI